MASIIVNDLYEVVQTIIFTIFGLTLAWDSLIWLTGSGMSTGFRAPIYALATNLMLCVAFVIASSVARRFSRRRSSEESARPSTVKRPIRGDVEQTCH